MELPKEYFTKRLVLRPLSTRYAQVINDEMTDEVIRYLPIGKENTAQTRAWILSALARDRAKEQWTFLIFRADTNEFIGGGGLEEINTRAPRTGIWLKQAAHGQGYGKEVILEVQRWANANLDYDYLLHRCDKRNTASCKIAESLGGTVGNQYKGRFAGDKELDLVEYHIPR